MKLHIGKITFGEDSHTAIIIRVKGTVIVKRVLHTTIKRLAGKIRIYP